VIQVREKPLCFCGRRPESRQCVRLSEGVSHDSECRTAA
jgi:hypothetical protein